MKGLGCKGLKGVLASFLFLVCIKTCICQDRKPKPPPSNSPDHRPRTSPLHPKPTMSPVHRFPTKSTGYSRKIRPSATRDSIHRSHTIHPSMKPDRRPRTSPLHPRPTMSPVHRFPTKSKGYSRKIRPSATRDSIHRSHTIHPSMKPDRRPRSSPLHPRPTMSPVHRFPTKSKGYSRKIRPSATRDSIHRSHTIHPSMKPDRRPRTSPLHPRPTKSPAHILPTGSSRSRDHIRRLPSSGAPRSSIRPSATRDPVRSSRSIDSMNSTCFMLKTGKAIIESLPQRGGLVAVIVGSQYQGAWQYSLNYDSNWKEIKCSSGKALVLSVKSFLRFRPSHDGFHGAAKVRAVEFKGSVRSAGLCVSLTTKPQVQYTVAVLVPPMVVTFGLAKLEDIEINEDEIDKKGKQLSDLFAVKNRIRLVADDASLRCIPDEIKKRYLAQMKEVNERSRPAVAMTQAPDVLKGSIEYRCNKLGPWKPVPIFTPLPLDCFVRLSPVPNANGKTSIKVVASALVPRDDPIGFNDLKPCVRDFLKEMDNLNYVYKGLLEIFDKAFEKTKEKGTVTIDGLISTLQQLGRTVDKESSIHVERARDIFGKVKEICAGKMKKEAFFEWYDKTISPKIKKTPCEMIHGSIMCLYAKRAIEVQIRILPMDDQPKIEESRIHFPPIPNAIGSTYEDGVPVFMLMKADQRVVEKLMLEKLSNKLLDIMAKGSNPDLLIKVLPESVQRIGRYSKSKCATDSDGDELGIGVLASSPSIRNETRGRWLFKKQGTSSWKSLKKGFRELIQNKRSCKPMALLKPGDRLKFQPMNRSLLWNNTDAQKLTRLEFHAWEGKDNRTSGVQCVDFNASSARFSNSTSSITVTRLGCDNFPGSMATHDLCDVCGGNNACVGCDGKLNSGFKLDECSICYDGKTVDRKPKLDCAYKCDNSSFLDECGNCQSRSTLKRTFTDCAGTCKRKPGYGARYQCGACVGGVTGKPLNFGMDACGKCGGDNSTCTDCKGIVKGPNRKDECKQCRNPESHDFNGCTQMFSVSSVTLKASGPSFITVKATGIKRAKTASCVLQNGAGRIALQRTTVSFDTKTVVSYFSLRIKSIAPGLYTLKCTFDSSSTEVEFTQKRLVFYDDKSVAISRVKPNFALRDKTTNVTIHGSGFLDKTTTKCVLEINTSPPLLLKARFIDSSRIMCLIPSIRVTGEFKLSVTFSGKFDGIEKKTSFAIKAIAPLPVSCELLKELKHIEIKFDESAAPLTRSLKCTDLFSSSSARMIGREASCQFRGKRLIVTLPTDNPFTRNGRMLTLAYEKIRNAFGKLTHYRDGVSEVTVNCSRPTKPKPVVEIRGADSAGHCQIFRIEAKATGSGKLKYAWSASFSKKTEDVVSASYQADMTKLNKFLSNIHIKYLVIPRQFVLPNVKYEVEVTVTDVFQQQVKGVVSLTRDDSNAPRVYVAGNKTRKVTVDSILKLKAIAISSSQCNQKSTRDKILFTWTCSSSVKMKGIFISKLLINRKLLSPGKEYEFEVLACQHGQCSRTSVNVITKSRPLESKIKGGKQRSIGEHDALTLDGRASEDPDADPKKMKYSWSCQDPDGYTCYYPKKANPSELIRLSIPDEPVVHINTKEQLPVRNGTYKFTLTVSKGSRSSTSEIKIKVERGSPPKVKFFDINKANPNKKIVVRAQVVSKAPVTQYEFSIVEESKEGFAYIELEEDVVMSEIRGEVKRKSDSSEPARRNIPLVFKPGKLAGNATYRIRITATYGDMSSYAETDLKTRAQTYRGDVLIEPSEGVAASTTFTIIAGDGWSVAEEDGPLVYRCGCLITDRRGIKNPKYFVEYSEKDSCETTLPPGDKANNNILKCFIEACNVHGSCSRAEQDVTVTPKKIEAGDVTKAKQLMFEGSDLGDSSSATSAIRSLLLSAKARKDGSKGDEEEEDEDVNKIMESTIKTVIEKVLDANENGEAQSEDEKILLKETLEQTVEVAETFDKERISVNVAEIDKAGEEEEDESESTSRRKRRSASERKPVVEEKTSEQVETTLNIYNKLIEPLNFSNDSMTIKEQFLSTLDELGRSMCKGLFTGESPLAAESIANVLRSEKNSFENVHLNYTLIGCDNCTFYESKIAQMLLGKSLKDMYEDWDCTEDGCNGACVVSAQMSHDLLARSLNENTSRVSDVVYVKLFNPETLVAMTIPKLATPITFDIPLNNVTDAQSSRFECHKWDASSYSWTTTEVTTSSTTTEGGHVSLKCTSNHLGFFTVFDSNQSPSSSTTSPPTSQDSQTTTLISYTMPPTSNMETTATSGNDQQTELQFSLDVSFDAVINVNNKDSVIVDITSSIASSLGVSTSRISNLSIHPGSIIVYFVLLPGGTGEQSVQNLTENFRSLVQNGNFAVTLSNGQILDVIRTSFLQGSSIPSSTPPPPTGSPTASKELKKSGLSQTTLIAIILVISLAALTIIAVLAFYYQRKKDQNQKVQALKEEAVENWVAPGDCKNAKTDIPMKGIHNEGHVYEEAMVKGSEEPLPPLPGTPSYPHDY